MAKVKFSYADVSAITLKNKTRVKQFIEEIFYEERKDLDALQYVFCSDEYLLKINQSFLQHNYYTDIVTFDLSENGKGTTGEVYISIDRVRDNAIVHQAHFQNQEPF